MDDLKYITRKKNKSQNMVLLLGMLIFTVGTYTLNTFISSLIVEVAYLILMSVLFLLYYTIQNKGFIIYKIELMWLVFFMYFLFNILYQSNFSKTFFVDILVFFVLFLILLLIKLDIEYYKISINIMLVITVIYAFSTFFQYFNIDLYTRLVLPLFSSGHQVQIMTLYNNSVYTGFTTQTAYLAGYLVYGIGGFLLFFKERTTKLSRLLSIIAILFLFMALLLTGKRAHLLFMIIALALTYLFSTELKKFFSKSLKLIFTLIMTIIAWIVLFRVYEPNIDTPIIGKVYYRISDTITGFIAGEDITSGRTLLYDYAFKLFNETPIFGIGWKEFHHLSIGVINQDAGSHPHNIYFQLLTELGLVGFILFMIPITYILFKTIKILMNTKLLFNLDMRWKTVLQFSLFSQMFFLLYGITGNGLTDHVFILMWGFAATITLSSMKYIKRKANMENKYDYEKKDEKSE